MNWKLSLVRKKQDLALDGGRPFQTRYAASEGGKSRLATLCANALRLGFRKPQC